MQNLNEDDSKDLTGGRFSIKAFVQEELVRPFKFLVTKPIVTFCAALCGIAFGLIYGLT